MPFASDKQRRYLYSQKPEVAKKFAAHKAKGGPLTGYYSIGDWVPFVEGENEAKKRKAINALEEQAIKDGNEWAAQQLRDEGLEYDEEDQRFYWPTSGIGAGAGSAAGAGAGSFFGPLSALGGGVAGGAAGDYLEDKIRGKRYKSDIVNSGIWGAIPGGVGAKVASKAAAKLAAKEAAEAAARRAAIKRANRETWRSNYGQGVHNPNSPNYDIEKSSRWKRWD